MLELVAAEASVDLVLPELDVSLVENEELICAATPKLELLLLKLTAADGRAELGLGETDVSWAEE
jgi:hypothetical protein